MTTGIDCGWRTSTRSYGARGELPRVRHLDRCQRLMRSDELRALAVSNAGNPRVFVVPGVKSPELSSARTSCLSRYVSCRSLSLTRLELVGPSYACAIWRSSRLDCWMQFYEMEQLGSIGLAGYGLWNTKPSSTAKPPVAGNDVRQQVKRKNNIKNGQRKYQDRP